MHWSLIVILSLLGLFFIGYNVVLRIFLKFKPVPTPPLMGPILKSGIRKLYRNPEKMLSVLGSISSHTFLEIGPGEGQFSLEIAKRIGPDGKLYCVDIQKYFFAKTEQALDQAGYTNTELILGTASDLPMEDNSVDTALAVAVLPLIPDPQNAIRELYRVLKPGGSLLVSEEVLSPEYIFTRESVKRCSAAGFVPVSKKTNILGHIILFKKPDPVLRDLE